MQRSSANPSTENERRLAEIDALIRNGRDDIDAQIERANLLNLLDRQTESLDLFIEIVKRSPTNFRALNEFGNLLSSMGHVAAACRVYTEAIKQHPENPIGHVNLANLLLQGGSLEEAKKALRKCASS